MAKSHDDKERLGVSRQVDGREDKRYRFCAFDSCNRKSTDGNLLENSSLMKASISFRPLVRSDFPLLQEWLSAPHVAAWWNERLDLPGIEAKYGPPVDGAEPMHMFVIEQEGGPIGWIQWYLWSDYPEHAARLGAEPASAGIDLAIGELRMTGLGLGPAAIREFVKQVVFANSEVRAVIADPEEGNLRSLRAFEKAGFSAVRTVRPAGEGCRRQVVRLDRSDIPDPREYELRAVQTEADWTAYHRIRRTVLFEARGRFGVYNANNPDDRAEGNLPLLLVFRGDIVGAVRLDCGSSDVGIIRQLAIDWQAQGRGHGRTLLQMLAVRGKTFGLRVLEVNSDGQAVGFYQRFGFDLIDGKREHPMLRLSIR